MVIWLWQLLAPHYLPGSHCRMLSDILAAAMTDKCWVFDLYSTHSKAHDFKSSLLSCLINGLGHATDDNQRILARKLLYAITWQRHDILLKVLQATVLPPNKRIPVLNVSLIEALSRNEVAAVKILLDCGASIDQFEIKGKSCYKEKEDQMSLVRSSVANMQALIATRDHDYSHDDGNLAKSYCWRQSGGQLFGTRRKSACTDSPDKIGRALPEVWEKLIRLTKQDTRSDHIKILNAKAKEELKIISQCKGQGEIRTQQAPHIEPLPQEEQNQLFQIISTQLTLIKQQSAYVITKCSTDVLALKSTKRLMILQRVYQQILGESFRYKIGSQA